MLCPRCQTQNDDTARFCKACSQSLAHAPEVPAARSAPSSTLATPMMVAMPTAPTMVANPPIQVTPVYAMPVSQPPQGGLYAHNKKPWLALILSWFLPGLGQLYNADILKGLLLLASYFFSYWLAGASFLVLFFLPFVVWLWGVVDAYKVASRKKPLWA
jgi:TM2 domain-containing membrane protein YozV